MRWREGKGRIFVSDGMRCALVQFDYLEVSLQLHQGLAAKPPKPLCTPLAIFFRLFWAGFAVVKCFTVILWMAVLGAEKEQIDESAENGNCQKEHQFERKCLRHFCLLFQQ
jgi:hypothetical protein